MSDMRVKLVTAATALLLVSLTACEGGTLLDGTITDAAGNPIASAVVTLEVIGGLQSKDRQQSDEHGKYQVSVTHYPERTNLIVTVSREGFQPFQRKFKSKGTHQHMDVRLQPAEANSPSTR